MPNELAVVERLSHTPMDVPNEVVVFRFIIYDLKRRILDTLDTPSLGGTDSNQEIGNVNEVVKKIKQLGNILQRILRSQDPHVEFKDQPDIYEILELFESADPLDSENFKCPSCHQRKTIDRKLHCSHCNSKIHPLRFKTLGREARDLCMYYVNVDIYLLPFDLSSDHANSVRSK
jgi:hypothetical protein